MTSSSRTPSASGSPSTAASSSESLSTQTCAQELGVVVRRRARAGRSASAARAPARRVRAAARARARRASRAGSRRAGAARRAPSAPLSGSAGRSTGSQVSPSERTVHLPPVALVAELEARRCAPGHVVDGGPERRQRRQKLGAVLLGAARVEQRLRRRDARAPARRGTGAPPGRGGSPGRKSRARFPSSAITPREQRPAGEQARGRREHERRREARDRRSAPRQRVRIGVRDEARPPAGPSG